MPPGLVEVGVSFNSSLFHTFSNIYLTICTFQEMFDIILDENQLEDACEHMADYLEAYWRSTHPSSSNPPNPVVTKLSTATLPPNAAPISDIQVTSTT